MSWANLSESLIRAMVAISEFRGAQAIGARPCPNSDLVIGGWHDATTPYGPCTGCGAAL